MADHDQDKPGCGRDDPEPCIVCAYMAGHEAGFLAGWAELLNGVLTRADAVGATAAIAWLRSQARRADETAPDEVQDRAQGLFEIASPVTAVH